MGSKDSEKHVIVQREKVPGIPANLQPTISSRELLAEYKFLWSF